MLGSYGRTKLSSDHPEGSKYVQLFIIIKLIEAVLPAGIKTHSNSALMKFITKPDVVKIFSMMTAIMQNADREVHLFRIESYGRCGTIESVYQEIFDGLCDDFSELYLEIVPPLLLNFDVAAELRELERLAVYELAAPPLEQEIRPTSLFDGSQTTLVPGDEMITRGFKFHLLLPSPLLNTFVPVLTLIRRRLVPEIHASTKTLSSTPTWTDGDLVCGRSPFNLSRASEQRSLIRKFLTNGYYFQSFIRCVGGRTVPPVLLSTYTQSSCIMRSHDPRTNFLSLDFFPASVPSLPRPPTK